MFNITQLSPEGEVNGDVVYTEKRSVQVYIYLFQLNNAIELWFCTQFDTKSFATSCSKTGLAVG